MKLSVIIPTHNRAAMLRQTLAALDRQTLPRALFQIIVVDDGSDEETRREIRSARSEHDFILLEKPQGGLASARNLGAANARGEILLFLDDDVVPGPQTLEQHLRSHEGAPRPSVVLGSLPYPHTFRVDSFLWYLEKCTHYDLYKDPKKYPGGRPPLPPLNGNSSIGRDLFIRVGRYDESFRQYGGEDLELGHRLARSGAGFVYNPLAIGYHHHLKDFPRFCIDMERAGESLIRVYRKHPEIRAAKKIDVLEDPLWSLPGRKRILKIIMSATFACPWILAVPRAAIRLGGRAYPLRHVLFPLYRWVAHFHYALGMKRGLAASA